MFWNPGDVGAPAGGLLDRTAKEVRNPLTAAAFRGIGLAGQAGTGIRSQAGDLRAISERQPVVGTGAGRAADRGDDFPADPPLADMGSDHGDQVRAEPEACAHRRAGL